VDIGRPSGSTDDAPEADENSPVQEGMFPEEAVGLIPHDGVEATGSFPGQVVADLIQGANQQVTVPLQFLAEAIKEHRG
jgi:hypothetical protein